MGQESVCNAGDPGSNPGSGRFPGEGNGNPLPYSCLENPMDGGVWQATIHGVTKSRTQLSDFTHVLICDESVYVSRNFFSCSIIFSCFIIRKKKQPLAQCNRHSVTVG